MACGVRHLGVWLVGVLEVREELGVDVRGVQLRVKAEALAQPALDHLPHTPNAHAQRVAAAGGLAKGKDAARPAAS